MSTNTIPSVKEWNDSVHGVHDDFSPVDEEKKTKKVVGYVVNGKYVEEVVDYIKINDRAE
jgi:hypothetical protein